MELEKLKAPFRPDDIEWRVQQAGTGQNGVWARVLAYVTNRAIMDRLDEVCGPGGWENEFKEGPGGGIICGISIHIHKSTEGHEYHRIITKWDGAENTDIEAVKGGLSNAMKRAAVQWGIGRYLYRLESAFANVCPNGKNWVKENKQKNIPSFKWNPPVLPQWAVPEGTTQQAPAPAQTQPADDQAPPADSKPKGKLRFEMSDFPKYKSGNHVFEKGPKREMWGGWTWKRMAENHYEMLMKGYATIEADPITNMLSEGQATYITGWNLEMAQEIDRMARFKMAAASTKQMADQPPDDDFNLDDVPF